MLKWNALCGSFSTAAVQLLKLVMGWKRSTFPAVLKASEHLARILKEKGGEEQMSQEVSFPIKLLTLDVTGAQLFCTAVYVDSS